MAKKSKHQRQGRRLNADKLMKDLRREAREMGATTDYDFDMARSRVVERLPRPQQGQKDTDKAARAYALQMIETRQQVRPADCERMGVKTYDEAAYELMQREQAEYFGLEPNHESWRYEGIDDPRYQKDLDLHRKNLARVHEQNRALDYGIEVAILAMSDSQIPR